MPSRSRSVPPSLLCASCARWRRTCCRTGRRRRTHTRRQRWSSSARRAASWSIARGRATRSPPCCSCARCRLSAGERCSKWRAGATHSTSSPVPSARYRTVRYCTVCSSRLVSNDLLLSAHHQLCTVLRSRALTRSTVRYSTEYSMSDKSSRSILRSLGILRRRLARKHLRLALESGDDGGCYGIPTSAVCAQIRRQGAAAAEAGAALPFRPFHFLTASTFTSLLHHCIAAAARPQIRRADEIVTTTYELFVDVLCFRAHSSLVRSTRR